MALIPFHWISFSTVYALTGCFLLSIKPIEYQEFNTQCDWCYWELKCGINFSWIIIAFPSRFFGDTYHHSISQNFACYPTSDKLVTSYYDITLHEFLEQLEGKTPLEKYIYICRLKVLLIKFIGPSAGYTRLKSCTSTPVIQCSGLCLLNLTSISIPSSAFYDL